MKSFIRFLAESSIPSLNPQEKYLVRWSKEDEHSNPGRWAYMGSDLEALIDAVSSYELRFRAAEFPNDYRQRPAHGFLHIGRTSPEGIKTRSTNRPGVVEVVGALTTHNIDVVLDFNSRRIVWKR